MWYTLAGTLASICYGWCLQSVLRGDNASWSAFFLSLAVALTFVVLTALDRNN